MTTAVIQEKVKLITDSKGKPVEVILPYRVYKHLLELETTMEIFSRDKTQASIKRAKEDIKEGRTKSFSDAKEAVKWLDE